MSKCTMMGVCMYTLSTCYWRCLLRSSRCLALILRPHFYINRGSVAISMWSQIFCLISEKSPKKKEVFMYDTQYINRPRGTLLLSLDVFTKCCWTVKSYPQKEKSLSHISVRMSRARASSASPIFLRMHPRFTCFCRLHVKSSKWL